MASRGSKKGERRGGRAKGTPNKATRERHLLAQRIAAEQQGKPGRKLAKEVLDDLMHTALGMAAKYQPLPAGVVPMNGQKPDEAKFVEYLKLAGGFATDLAPYQSFRFKAVLMSQETPPGGSAIAPGSGDQAGAMSRMSAQQAYRLLRDQDVIDVSPAAQLVDGKKIKKATG